MKTVQWRPEVNSLTMPQSYSVRHIPRETVGYDGVAARMVRNNPGLTAVQAEASLRAAVQAMQDELAEGNRITLEDAFSITLSFTARLENPDDPLPPLEDCLQVRAFASRPFVDAVRKTVLPERLPMSEKLPQINTAEDTVLKLADVLYAGSALRLKGADLFFDSELYGGECVIAGTRSGSAAQTRFVSVTDSEVVVLPVIPSQPDPWNNEYTISISTRYTEHGTLRTGTYRRKLRTPLLISNVTHHPDVGILSGAGTAPFAKIKDGTASASLMLRIQAALDIADGHLELSLLDMKEGGKSGAPVRVTANGTFTLNGYDGASLTSLSVAVENFTGLADLVRNGYAGRLVDVLDVRVA
ncbi:hypothetical protein [Candidatus Electronema sp. JM]|uniref:hypothetical protein n=1 Tax=Candidatus Electronema sp. JM TaxID=3401571 RepID=UPI003AA7C345